MLTVCAFPHTANKGLPYCTPTWEPGGPEWRWVLVAPQWWLFIFWHAMMQLEGVKKKKKKKVLMEWRHNADTEIPV